MTNQPSTTPANNAAGIQVQGHPGEAAKLLRADIGTKWGKFSAQELGDLKDNDDLVSQLVAKYGLDKEAAARDAATVVKGRNF
jgi:hypothetical protein